MPSEEQPAPDGKHTVSGDQQRRKRTLRKIIPLVLILSLIGVLIWYFFVRVPSIPANLFELSGRIETDDSAVAAKTSGRIKEITVREGEVLHIPPSVEHQVEALEDTLELEVFSPIRADWIDEQD